MRASSSVLRHLVPTANEVPALLESISSAARRAGLEISDVAAGRRRERRSVRHLPVQARRDWPLSSDRPSSSANVASLPRIVAPINLTLTPTTRTGELQTEEGRAVPRREVRRADVRRARVA